MPTSLLHAAQAPGHVVAMPPLHIVEMLNERWCYFQEHGCLEKAFNEEDDQGDAFIAYLGEEANKEAVTAWCKEACMEGLEGRSDGQTWWGPLHFNRFVAQFNVHAGREELEECNLPQIALFCADFQNSEVIDQILDGSINKRWSPLGRFFAPESNELKFRMLLCVSTDDPRLMCTRNREKKRECFPKRFTSKTTEYKLLAQAIMDEIRKDERAVEQWRFHFPRAHCSCTTSVNHPHSKEDIMEEGGVLVLPDNNLSTSGYWVEWERKRPDAPIRSKEDVAILAVTAQEKYGLETAFAKEPRTCYYIYPWRGMDLGLRCLYCSMDVQDLQAEDIVHFMVQALTPFSSFSGSKDNPALAYIDHRAEVCKKARDNGIPVVVANETENENKPLFYLASPDLTESYICGF